MGTGHSEEQCVLFVAGIGAQAEPLRVYRRNQDVDVPAPGAHHACQSDPDPAHRLPVAAETRRPQHVTAQHLADVLLDVVAP